MRTVIFLAIAPWMIRDGGEEPYRNPPWRYRLEMPAPPSLFTPLDGLPLVRPRNWSPRLCCPNRPTA